MALHTIRQPAKLPASLISLEEVKNLKVSSLFVQFMSPLLTMRKDPAAVVGAKAAQCSRILSCLGRCPYLDGMTSLGAVRHSLTRCVLAGAFCIPMGVYLEAMAHVPALQAL